MQAKKEIESLKNYVEDDIASYSFSHIKESFANLVQEKNIDAVYLISADTTLKILVGEKEYTKYAPQNIKDNFSLLEINNAENFIISIPLYISNHWGSVHIVYSLKEINKEIRLTKNKITLKIQESIEKAIYTAIIIALFFVLFMYFIVKRFIAPIILLTNIVKEISAGNLDISEKLSGIKTKDEIEIGRAHV